MWYLLLADQHVYRCRTCDALVDKLVWGRDQRYATAKARRSSAFTDRPLMPAEAVALVEAATEVVLAGEQVAVGSRGYET